MTDRVEDQNQLETSKESDRSEIISSKKKNHDRIDDANKSVLDDRLRGGNTTPKVLTIVLVIIIFISAIGSFIYYSWNEEEENHPPIAVANADQTSVLMNDIVTFNASESSDRDGDRLTFEWDFDDGSETASGMIVTHNFTTAGTFIVSMVVSDGEESDKDSIEIHVSSPNLPPTVDFEVSPSHGDTTTVFQLTDTSNDDGTIVSWTWDFGDGSQEYAQNPTHIYDTPGTYLVRLMVLDDLGETGNATRNITVSESESIGTVVINEIMFNPTEGNGVYGRGEEDIHLGGSEWIELYNGFSPQALYGWTLTNRSGNPLISLPDWVLPKDAYFVIVFGIGDNDDDFSDGAGYYYFGIESNFFNDIEDECALFNNTPSDSSILDFVSWCFDGDNDPGQAHDDAVAAEIWIPGEHFEINVEENDTIGRTKDSLDSDTHYDWWLHGGIQASTPSPGHINHHPKIEQSAFPLVIQDGTEKGNSIMTRLTVKNNVNHDISDLTITLNVEAEDNSIVFSSISVIGDPVFNPSYRDNSTNIEYIFSLIGDTQLEMDQVVDLVCVYDVDPSKVIDSTISIEPQPFNNLDLNYNQLNDHLEEIAADIIMQGNESTEIIEVIVILDHPVTPADITAFERQGGTVDYVYSIFDGFDGNITVDGMNAYVGANRDSIEMIDPSVPVEEKLDISVDNIGVKDVWNNSDKDLRFKGDPETTIALIDSGIDDAHPAFGGGGGKVYVDVGNICEGNVDNEIIIDFNGNKVYNKWYDHIISNGTNVGLQSTTFTQLSKEKQWEIMKGNFTNSKIVGWKDLKDYSTEPEDQSGHGTHVAAIAAGTGKGKPSDNYIGVAPDTKLFMIRASGGSNRLTRAMDHIQKVGESYNVIVTSMSMIENSETAKANVAAQKLIESGIMMITVASNEFDEGGTVLSPGEVPKTITVGAVNDKDQVTSYSSNDAKGGIIKPDVLAPGGSISAFDGISGIMSAYSDDQELKIDDYYVELKGTSMAAPHVAGEVALIIDAITDYDSKDENDDGKTDNDPWNGKDDDGDCRIDNDLAEWSYREEDALAVKRTILMTSYEVHGGERVYPLMFYDENGDSIFKSDGSDEVFIDINMNGKYEKGTDKIWLKGPDEEIDTTDGQTFGLVKEGSWVEYLDKHAVYTPKWKGEYNAPRDKNSDGITDTFDRGGKDGTEGYGRVCVDAAIDAVTKEITCPVNKGKLGSSENKPSDPKVWARKIELFKNAEYTFELDGPNKGDFDLYLYNIHYKNIFNPSSSSVQYAILGKNVVTYFERAYTRRDFSNGEPQILSKSVKKGSADEKFTVSLKDYGKVPERGIYYVVVKWIEGSGEFTLKVTKKTDWTIMVYMGAEKFEQQAFKDINEMESIGSDGNMSIIVLVDYMKMNGLDGTDYDNDNTTYTHYIRCDKKLDRITSPACYKFWDDNLGDNATLTEFIINVTKYYPADRYLLDIWGEGYGWKGVIKDVEYDNDTLYMGELKQGLGDSATLFDIIGFDSDFMGMVEVANQVKPFAGIMVGSEERTLQENWPYDDIIGWLDTHPKDTSENFAKTIVQKYHEYYMNILDLKHTISAVNLSWKGGGGDFDSLVKLIDQFAKDMYGATSLTEWGLEDYDYRFLKHYDPNDNTQIRIKKHLYDSDRYDDGNYIDLRDFMNYVFIDPEIPMPYKEKAEEIVNLLEKGKGVIIDEEHTVAHLGSNGLSIYFPINQTKYGDPFNKIRNDPFDDPWPSAEITAGTKDYPSELALYSEDHTSEWGTVPYKPFGDDPPHPLNETPNFDFVRVTWWDEFLHRYYKPVADAGEDQIVYTSDGIGIVNLDGSGSSDADGVITNWVWDIDATKDNPIGDQDLLQSDDFDADERDETIDDRDLSGEKVIAFLPIGKHTITLTVWDDHRLEPDTNKDYYHTRNISHSSHLKTDQDQNIIFVLGKIKEIGYPKYDRDGMSFVTSSTRFDINDHLGEFPGEMRNYYRVWYDDTWTGWMDYTGPFTLEGECEHRIEFYGEVDWMNETIESPIFKNKHFVDDSPPRTTPVPNGPRWGDFWKDDTRLNLSGEDQGTEPCIVGLDHIKYRIWYDGIWTDWLVYSENLTFGNEGMYFMEYYGVDLLNNSEEVQNLSFTIDLTPPVVEKVIGAPSAQDGLWVRSNSSFTLIGLDLDAGGEQEGVGIEIIY